MACGHRAPSGRNWDGTAPPSAFPFQYMQQTPTAACASNAAASMHWGLGPSATNKLRRVYTGALLATTIITYQRG
ncbi:MAG: hypothetical protein ACLSAF_02865 [Intestinimonas sp.]